MLKAYQLMSFLFLTPLALDALRVYLPDGLRRKWPRYILVIGGAFVLLI